MLPQQESHQMELDKVSPTGIEEWYCPICSRRIVLTYKPVLNTLVLNEGDQYANHSGERGGARITNRSIDTPEDEELSENDIPSDVIAWWNANLSLPDDN
ncbi:hypothetical protein A2955_04790 [Candidatus Woesebacteria bacterium RIFCSPLOWO2_01_FULL_37_19]|uniref:Uncharacterized protein n=1 Tax=Candidatus Woesebacteria bacterium RIFCSPLOWO2_01_FULL_37_19 TaxID=1802514 RepID=A0A1F8B971_9BACT|nr:MAG: hypothetical protein A2955_04790 [Candidatus Woesebacteria bacterium RIFCSPLOWO2_01_FULL_37_19]